MAWGKPRDVPSDDPFYGAFERHYGAHDGPVHEPDLELLRIIRLDRLVRGVGRIEEARCGAGDKVAG